MVLFFPAEGEQYGDFYVYGDDYATLSKENATFVRIPFTANRDKAPESDSPVPSSKILSDNPSRDYGVAVNRATFIVTDWFGNPLSKVERKASASELKTLIGRVSGQVETLTKKLQRNYDSAKAAWDKQDRTGALNAIGKNFKEGVVGLEPQANTISLYTEISEAIRTQIEELAAKGDMDGLRKIAKDRNLRGTSLASEAEEAMKKARPTTQEKKDEVQK